MKVHIQNYQTIKDVDLDIEGFTVIVGKSNVGKTALLRAVEGAMFNDPVTDKVRKGCTDVFVTIDYKDISWTWKKGENFNDYIITTPTGTVSYSRVGVRTPTEITDAGFKEWWVDREKTRIQTAAWYDPIFLLDRGGTAITELMTAVTRLDVVNKASRNCAIELKNKKSHLKLRGDDLIRANAHVKSFDVLGEIDTHSIENSWNVYLSLKRSIYTVQIYLSDYDKLTSSIDAIQLDIDVPVQFVYDTSILEKISDWIDALSQLDRDIQKISIDVTIPDKLVDPEISILDKWVGMLFGLDTTLAYLEKFDDITLPDIDLIDLFDQYDQINQYVKDLYTLSKNMVSQNKEISDSEISLHKDLERLEKLRGLIQECPVCGRSM